MTPEQQRIAIAEACGMTNIRLSKAWENWDEPPSRRPVCSCPGGNVIELPDYISDLNAMHEAEKTLGNGRLEDFTSRLNHIIRSDNTKWITGENTTFNTASNWIWNATAAQRAEAFLRTIGKWKDE